VRTTRIFQSHLGWRVFAGRWVVLLFLATEKGPNPGVDSNNGFSVENRFPFRSPEDTDHEEADS
jgi:hypothetical protein